MLIIIIAAGLVFIFLWHRNKGVKRATATAVRATAGVQAAVRPFPQAWRDILEKYFTYYKRLSRANKQVFEQKLLYFILSKRWVPRQFEAVTDEMKVLIGACAIQLTFGLPRAYLQHFNTLIIYPDNYYSTITKRYHKGEVNPAYGVIVLSWRSFAEGYLLHPENAVNVGLHEMAHALRIENIIRSEDYKYFDEELLNKFDAYAYRICHENDPGLLFFRPYACTNEHEFFAVAVENFFERPAAFKSAEPQLYNILCRLLNQDPLLLTAHKES